MGSGASSENGISGHRRGLASYRVEVENVERCPIPAVPKANQGLQPTRVFALNAAEWDAAIGTLRDLRTDNSESSESSESSKSKS